MHARTSGSSGNVRDRLKRSVLSGRLVASGNGDELLRPFGGGPRFRATSRKLFRPKLTFSDRNRLEPHVGVLPASLLVLHAVIPPVRGASAARDGGPRNRPNRYESSRGIEIRTAFLAAAHRSIK